MSARVHIFIVTVLQKLLFFSLIFTAQLSIYAQEEKFVEYKVKSGDTLIRILLNYSLKPVFGNNGSLKETLELNPNKKANLGNLIYPGEVIKIPTPVKKAFKELSKNQSVIKKDVVKKDVYEQDDLPIPFPPIEPIPEQKPIVVKKEPIPEQKPIVVKKEPIPEQKPMVVKKEPIPEQKPIVVKKEDEPLLPTKGSEKTLIKDTDGALYPTRPEVFIIITQDKNTSRIHNPIDFKTTTQTTNFSKGKNLMHSFAAMKIDTEPVNKVKNTNAPVVPQEKQIDFYMDYYFSCLDVQICSINSPDANTKCCQKRLKYFIFPMDKKSDF